MQERRLTISRLREPRRPRHHNEVRPERVMPFVRLSGQYLEDLGFEVRKKVRVATEPGRLVITPTPAEGR